VENPSTIADSRLVNHFTATLATIAQRFTEGFDMMTMGQAAKQAGVSKATLSRAIKSGKISANKNDKGGWDIDPAELFRVYPATPATGAGNGAMKRNATPANSPDETPETVASMARLEAEVHGLKAQMELMREQLDDMKIQREKWQDQAQSAQRLLTDMRPQRRSWFGFGRKAG
jgi:predicted DNA-binding protein (UPF0251 family)